MKPVNSFNLFQFSLLTAFNKLSEWTLFNANSAIFQLYHGESKLIFNEMMMRSAYSVKIYLVIKLIYKFMKPVNSFNLFQFSCAASDIIFNLLMLLLH
jgi:hypothetical protein